MPWLKRIDDRRYRPSGRVCRRWRCSCPIHRGATRGRHTFALGTWGGEFHPDFQPQSGEVVAHEHWAQSGFANTDLDAQLRQHGITHVVTIGLLANTCIESTSRFAMELGYHVTLVRDATAAVQPAMMHAAHELNGPTFAHAIVATADVVTAFKAAARP
ncbi:cysteine hydrolase [Streptomyces tubercidicus]|uniref:cysteine hydrolase n=1 Tax=Streptomyces tubercidicus TaxID=47759 RepID=UPI00280AB8A3|nr:cysteine hydrolase [Streptomyces tubercidicus]